METKIFHGEISPNDFAQALIGDFNRGKRDKERVRQAKHKNMKPSQTRQIGQTIKQDRHWDRTEEVARQTGSQESPPTTWDRPEDKESRKCKTCFSKRSRAASSYRCFCSGNPGHLAANAAVPWQVLFTPSNHLPCLRMRNQGNFPA